MASPSVGAYMPVIILSTVVFPAPLCPRKLKTSFSLMDRLRLSTALKLPNFFVRFTKCIGSYYLDQIHTERLHLSLTEANTDADPHSFDRLYLPKSDLYCQSYSR